MKPQAATPHERHVAASKWHGHSETLPSMLNMLLDGAAATLNVQLVKFLAYCDFGEAHSWWQAPFAARMRCTAILSMTTKAR